MKLVPSKNPRKESKLFGILAFVCGILSLALWFIGIGALAFGVRGIILSQRVKNKKYLIFSCTGVFLGVVSIIHGLILE